MLKRYIAGGLVFVVLATTVTSAFSAAPRAQDKKSDSQKLAEKVAKIGVGKKVELTLRQNGKKTKGTITRLDDIGFTVAEKKSRMDLTFKYDEVKRIDKDGGVAKWIFVGGVAAAVVLIIFGSQLCENEGGC